MTFPARSFSRYTPGRGGTTASRSSRERPGGGAASSDMTSGFLIAVGGAGFAGCERAAPESRRVQLRRRDASEPGLERADAIADLRRTFELEVARRLPHLAS